MGIIDKELKNENIEVLNAGVGSYHPSIYFDKISYLINNINLEFDELVVFIDISDAYDEFDKDIIENKTTLHQKINF